VGFNLVRACPWPCNSVGPGKFFGSVALLLGAMLSSAPSLAQDSTLGDPEAITIIGTVQRTVVPNIFGTVAVPFGTTPVSARWTRVMNASLDEPALTRLTAGGRELAPLQKLAYVQSAVNRTVRNRSGAHCGTDDGYWAAANETLVRGIGDCIDIAIAKVEALRQLGFQVRDLYLVTGRVFTGPLEAALLVRIGNQFWLLDAHSDQVADSDHVAAFTPIVTYGVGMTWAHGVPISRARLLPKPVPPVQTATKAEKTREYSGLDQDTIKAIASSTDH
jgi:predicted transglutaminase-like cysteine proteinase